jgi:lipopolysaccharide assembly outer membrane protein LptD (OstA)
VTRRPAFGYDGIVREGPADNIVTASGNVVVLINDIRVTTDTALWHWDSTEIELAGGVRVQLPRAPNAFHFENRRR